MVLSPRGILAASSSDQPQCRNACGGFAYVAPTGLAEVHFERLFFPLRTQGLRPGLLVCSAPTGLRRTGNLACPEFMRMHLGCNYPFELARPRPPHATTACGASPRKNRRAGGDKLRPYGRENLGSSDGVAVSVCRGGAGLRPSPSSLARLRKKPWTDRSVCPTTKCSARRSPDPLQS